MLNNVFKKKKKKKRFLRIHSILISIEVSGFLSSPSLPQILESVADECW